MLRSGMRSSIQRLATCTCVVAAVFSTPAAHAQEVSARDRQSAGEAYDRGTAAYLSEDYARAAQWFETAHRLAPAAAALAQATRAHRRAGHALEAATLALQLRALYPDDGTATRTAARALMGSEQYFRVDVECSESCTLEVGGSLLAHTSFFLEPGDHEVTASFESGSRVQTATGAAGESLTLTFEAPPPEATPAEPPDPGAVSDPGPGETPATASSGGGVPVAVTIIGMVATAALGAVLVWSGWHTLDGIGAYEDNPTEAGYRDGRAREDRTNALIGATGAAAIATLVLALFTDWGGSESDVQALIEIQAERGVIGLRTRF